MYYSIEDVRRGIRPLLPQHLEALRMELRGNVRATWKVARIQKLTAEKIMVLPHHWSFARIMYRTDGSLSGDKGYIAAQDYQSEIKDVITAFVGKR